MHIKSYVGDGTLGEFESVCDSEGVEGVKEERHDEHVFAPTVVVGIAVVVRTKSEAFRFSWINELIRNNLFLIYSWMDEFIYRVSYLLMNNLT